MTRDCFDQLFRENKSKVYNYLLRFVDCDDDAQDLFQDAWIALYQRIDQINPDFALPYMYRVAHNMALNWLKKRKNQVLRPAGDFARMPQVSHPVQSYQIVNKAIAGLPVKLATVVHLFYYDKLTYKEIGRQLGVSTKSVDSQLDRARQKLRKNIRIADDGSYELKD